MLPPLIGVIVVNYFGGDRTIECVEAVVRSTWPRDRLRVVVVDNGSHAAFAEMVERRVPDVRVVATGANLGFGGGCNAGIRALEDCDYIALLNNDAWPEPGWLKPLVDAIDRTGAGAAAPKVLLAGRFIPIHISAETTAATLSDPRSLGVQLCSARVGGADVSNRVKLVRGFWGWEYDETTIGGRFAWTEKDAVAHLPVDSSHRPGDAVGLRLGAGLGPTRADISAGRSSKTVTVHRDPTWFDVGPAPPASEVINNTGTVLLPSGHAADRGYLELDVGQYADEGRVFGWSGAAVVLTRSFLDDVGLFDERFFLYYEDADLSVRGRLRGWTYVYVPSSIVRHAHSATVGEESALATHLAARNRLVMLAKLAPEAMAGRAVAHVLRGLAGTAARDVGRRALSGQRPIVRHVGANAMVLLGFIRLLPHALGERRKIQRAAKVSAHEVFSERSDRGPSLAVGGRSSEPRKEGPPV